MDVDALVTAGNAALTEGRSGDAGAAFEAALAEGEYPEALDGLADVRYWQGDYATAVSLHERAYAAYRSRGEIRRAAVLAGYMLAFEYAAVYGDLAVASGWLERGKRLAEEAGDCVERGWVKLACVLATDDLAERERHIAAATEIARRFGDADLEFDALAYAGATLVERGRIAEGMRRLDEAAAAARGGEVAGHTAAGEIYCKMLLACEMTLDVRRAEQWVGAAGRLARRSGAGWVSAICRMHYGGILTAAGRWAEADAELAASVRLYDGTYRALRAGAVVRLADLRVRQGRLEEAERLLAGQEDDAYAVRPLIRLRVRKGEADVAAALLRRHLARHATGVLTVPMLALLTDAELAAGRPDRARDAAARLAALAEQITGPFVRAFASYAAGRSDDGGPRAVRQLEESMAAFEAAGVPFEGALARLELARRLAKDEPTVAIAEARTALGVFDRLGATWDADVAAAFLRSLGAGGRSGPRNSGLLSKREQEVLELLGLGLTNPEIATRLFISRKTASHHVSNVLAKLGLRNRAEAAAYARSAGR